MDLNQEIFAAPDHPEVNTLLNRILQISTVGIILFDPEGDIVWANDAFLQMCAFNKRDIDERRLRWDRLTPPEWMEASCRAIEQVRANGANTPYEKEYFRKDGSRFRGLFAAKALGSNRAVEFILDISQKHSAEVLLKESEERFRRLSEHSPIGIFQASLDAQVTYANPKAQEIFAMEEAKLKGEGWLSRVLPDDATMLRDRWPKAIQNNETFEVEYEIELPDASKRRICAHSVMLHEPTGHPFGVVGTVEDITARKRAEEALRQSEKLAAVGRLAASIAHEINNPLESITNLLYLARNSRDIDEIQSYLEIAERELRRISVISSQTLRFHKQSSSPRGLQASELLDEVLSIHQGRLVNSRIRVEKQCTPNLTVRCFDGEIRQVLNNLIGNAIDAMHAKGGGRLLLRCREATDWKKQTRGVSITIADTGTGMSPEVQKRAFEPFYTTKEVGGTGLGLWISQEIVTRHQGHLRMRSSQRPGKSGTVFTLLLPFDALVC